MSNIATTREVYVQFQRFVPQVITVLVAVPAAWGDARVEASLSDMYVDFGRDLQDMEWYAQDDGKSREGDHGMSREPVRASGPEFTFDPDGEIPDDPDE